VKHLFLLICIFTITFKPVEAGPVARLIVQALEDGSELAALRGSRAATKSLYKSREISDEEKYDLLAKEVDEVSGMMGYKLTNILMTYHTPGQQQISDEQYAEARSKFRRQISREKKNVVKFVHQTGLICIKLGHEFIDATIKFIDGSVKASDVRRYEAVLQDCENKLLKIRGYDRTQAKAFPLLFQKYSMILEDSGIPSELKQRLETSGLLLLLKNLYLNNYEALRKVQVDERSWFL